MADKENKIDISKLEEKLELLTGNDFEEAEKIERQTGNTASVISTTSSFAVRLAAMALGCLPHDLKALPIAKYTVVLSKTSNFLFGALAEEIALKKSENLQ